MQNYIDAYSCDIYIKIKDKAWKIIRDLGEFLNINHPENLKLWIVTDEWDLSINDNQAGNGPNYYYERNLKPDFFFDYFLSYRTSIMDVRKNVEFVDKIINFYWEKQVPAAIDSYEYAEHLVMKGGNDIANVFWANDQFPSGKIPPVIPEP